MKKHTYIFFSNFLGFSGSEVLLKDLMNSVSIRTDIKLVLVGYSEGDLLPFFSKDIEYISYPSFYKRHNTFIRRQISRFSTDKAKNTEYYFLQEVKRKFPDAVWILNTLWLTRILSFAKEEGIRSMIWIHEMAVAFEVLDANKINNLRTVPEKLICVSESVASSIRSLNPAGEVVVIYPGIFNEINLSDRKPKLKREDNPMKIGMAGRIDSNKNPIVFLNLARYLKQKNDLRFRLSWIGGGNDNGLFIYVNCAIENEGLKDFVEITGHLSGDEYIRKLSTLDLFFLTSNYDSFPLVMLEASSFGIPVIGFSSGGVTEFVDSDEVGEIMRDRSEIAIYNLLSNYYNGLMKFNPESIQRRCLYFSREKFINNFNTILR